MKIVLFILTLSSLCLARADTPRICVVCQQPLTGSFLLLSSPCFAERQPVCESCSRLEHLCFICGLPVKMNYLKLEDGRFLCQRDGKTAVTSQEEAERLFSEVKRDVRVFFNGLGVLPDRNVSLLLVDRFQMEKADTIQEPNHDKKSTIGLARTQLKDGRFEHTIYLLSGLPRQRLLAVGSHEYTHAWLRENMAKERQVDSDTVEGFCELIAYKLMVLRGEEIEQKAIKANLYSRGQIEALLQAESDYDFYRVARWLKNGLDEHLTRTNTARVLVLKEAASPAWSSPTQSTAPQALVLRGITGNAKRRFAIINDRTLQKNEETIIRIGRSNLVVRCLEITADAAVITVNGSQEKQQLSLEPN